MGSGQCLHVQVREGWLLRLLPLWWIVLLAWRALDRGALLLAAGWRTRLRDFGRTGLWDLGRTGLWDLGRRLAGDFALLLLLIGHFSKVEGKLKERRSTLD